MKLLKSTLIGCLTPFLVAACVAPEDDGDLTLDETEQELGGEQEEPDEPNATKLTLQSISTTPLSLSQPGTLPVTFKVLLDGDAAKSCSGTLSIMNKATSAVIYSSSLTLTGYQATKTANVTFPSSADYWARISMPATTSCVGGVKTSSIRVHTATSPLKSLTPGSWVYMASDDGGGSLSFNIQKHSNGHCSKAKFWIEDDNGAKVPGFDQTLTNIDTPKKIFIQGFLGMPAWAMATAVNPYATPIPDMGNYRAVLQGDSPDCSGTVKGSFTKKLPYIAQLLGTYNPLTGVNTKNHIETEVVDAGDELMFEHHQGHNDTAECNGRTICGFLKGLPTMGVLSHGWFTTVSSPYPIVKCSMEAYSGADLVIGIVNQPGDLPELHCNPGSHGIVVSGDLHGVGSWAQYKVKVYVKVPVP